MAIGKAINFVKKATTDAQFRAQCYKSNSRNEVMQIFGFNEVEFDDAINMQLVKCQSWEEAEAFQQIRMWFSILYNNNYELQRFRSSTPNC